MDDPLSALDADTEVHGMYFVTSSIVLLRPDVRAVFEALFGDSGLLKNKSVLLVTHYGMQLLSHYRL